MSLFKKMDSVLESKITQFKDHKSLQKIQESLSQVDDDYFYLVKWGLLSLSLFLPFVFLLPLSSSNSNLQELVDTHKKALSIADKVKQINASNQRKMTKIFTPGQLDNLNMIMQQLRAATEQNGIDPELIKASNFNKQALDLSDISKVSVDIKFNSLTGTQFIQLSSALSLKHNARVEETNIIKSEENKLEGTMKLIFYTRNYDK